MYKCNNCYQENEDTVNRCFVCGTERNQEPTHEEKFIIGFNQDCVPIEVGVNIKDENKNENVNEKEEKEDKINNNEIKNNALVFDNKYGFFQIPEYSKINVARIKIG
jgi:hypothetical protein